MPIVKALYNTSITAEFFYGSIMQQ